MKRKSKVRRSRDLPPPVISETLAERPNGPATPARISIESVDEHKTGSIEAVPQTDPQAGVAGFIEPGALDAGRTR